MAAAAPATQEAMGTPQEVTKTTQVAMGRPQVVTRTPQAAMGRPQAVTRTTRTTIRSQNTARQTMNVRKIMITLHSILNAVPVEFALGAGAVIATLTKIVTSSMVKGMISAAWPT